MGMTAAAAGAQVGSGALSSPNSAYQLTTVGGMGVFIVLHILDASSILPTLQPSKADKELALSVTSSGRNVLFVALGASTGVMISSVVPIISGTVGDPKSKGYGPMAFGAFAAMPFFGKAAALATVPE